MALHETMNQLHLVLLGVVKDLGKVHRGNKTAAQRVRVGTIILAKLGKKFRQESIAAERGGKLKKKAGLKKKKRK